MRLNMPIASANERLIALINRGYAALYEIQSDYLAKKAASTSTVRYDSSRVYEERMNEWLKEVRAELLRIFPTQLELNMFLHAPEMPLGASITEDWAYYTLNRNFEKFL